jgi:hypothetical protein
MALKSNFKHLFPKKFSNLRNWVDSHDVGYMCLASFFKTGLVFKKLVRGQTCSQNGDLMSLFFPLGRKIG